MRLIPIPESCFQIPSFQRKRRAVTLFPFLIRKTLQSSVQRSRTESARLRSKRRLLTFPPEAGSISNTGYSVKRPALNLAWGHTTTLFLLREKTLDFVTLMMTSSEKGKFNMNTNDKAVAKAAAFCPSEMPFS